MDYFKRLLDSREKRYEKQIELIEKNKLPIISFMLNIPGEDKNNPKFVQFHKKAIEKLENLLGDKIIESFYKNKDTGMYYLASVNMDGKELKKLLIELEETPSGRIYDLDVFDKNKEQITRSKLGLKPRKCLICDEIAKVCIRESRHNKEDILKKVNKIIDIKKEKF